MTAQLCLKDQQFGRAHLARHSIDVGKSSLGARLRTREVTGRDASLPAPLLSAFGILVDRGTVGALPQTPQGTLSLDPARGNAPCGVQRRRLWWGLGQRPNYWSGDHSKGSRQQRRRQRSVPASNFALPQKRPQAALSITCTLSRPWARPQHWSSRHSNSFPIRRDFASAEATKGQ